MKKMICAFFCAAAAAGAFAAGPFSVTVDMAADALFLRGFFGGYADSNEAKEGSPFKYQGDGDIKSFQSSAFDDGLLGRLSLAYSGERVGGTLVLKAESESVLGDWNVWLKYGGLRILGGNTAQRGQVSQYQNFDDFLKNKFDSLGILYPEWKRNPDGTHGNNFNITAEFPYGYASPGDDFGYTEFMGTDTADLFMPAGSTTRQTLGVLLDYTFTPLTVTASVGGLFSDTPRPFKMPWEHGEGERLDDYDGDYPLAEKVLLNFGFRAEGAKIADMVTVALVYKYADSWLAKLDTANNEIDIKRRLDEKVSNHAFGIYGTVTPIDGLGITAGYSGLIKAWSNSKFNETDLATMDPEYNEHDLSLYKEVRFPYYSGVDLRINYTGIKNLSLTLNNNVSFASVNGTELGASKEMYVKSWAYIGELNTKRSRVSMEECAESYFGVYNAFGAKYRFNENFTADFQAANQLGIFKLKWEKDPLQSVTDCLGVYAGVVSTIVEINGVKGSLRGGLDLRLHSYSYQATSAGQPVYKAGYFDFGIPIGLKVEF